MHHVISKDGTKIAYEKQGNGPAVILVSAAAANHHDTVKLAEQLAKYFTVYNYDRRGRGQSTDTAPYAVSREIEDIEALIQESGGCSYLFGSSSGAVLALEAASQLGNKITKLFLYEPPFIINEGRASVPADYVAHLNQLIASNQRNEAVEYFMTQAIGVPSEFLAYMKADPSWQVMEEMAHTLAYDGMVMGDTQSGQPLPTDRWHVQIPTFVMTGENSEAFFHDAAEALVALLPQGKHNTLSGQDHSAVMMAPADLATEITKFYQS
jgi:pimeloyl-ACP methyl ester carboxylesterase